MGKKIYITESQFNNLVESKQEKRKRKRKKLDVVKADRKGSEEVEKFTETVSKSTTRIKIAKILVKEKQT